MEYPFFLFLIFSFRLLNNQEVRRTQEGREGILPCGRDGKMASIALALYMNYCVCVRVSGKRGIC